MYICLALILVISKLIFCFFHSSFFCSCKKWNMLDVGQTIRHTPAFKLYDIFTPSMAIFTTCFHALTDYGRIVTRGSLLLRTMNFYYSSQKAAKNFRFFQIFFSCRQPYTWRCISGTSTGPDKVFSLMLWCGNISHALSKVCHFFSFVFHLVPKKANTVILAYFHLFFW